MRNRLRQALFVVLIGLVLASAAFGADLKLGDLPPPLKLPNFQEKTVELEPLLGQKAVLITFVAGWSKNCQAELLALQKVNESYSKRGLVILAVNLEKGTQTQDSNSDCLILSMTLERLYARSL